MFRNILRSRSQQLSLCISSLMPPLFCWCSFTSCYTMSSVISLKNLHLPKCKKINLFMKRSSNLCCSRRVVVMLLMYERCAVKELDFLTQFSFFFFFLSLLWGIPLSHLDQLTQILPHIQC